MTAAAAPIPKEKPARVYQSNRLVESQHFLSLNEKRLVLCAAAKINPMNAVGGDGYLTITAEHFATTFNIELRHAYEALNDACDRLYERDIKTVDKDGKTQRMRWVYKIEYTKGQGRVQLGFSPEILPHLTELHNEFTGYQLRQISGLSTFYAVRLYELMAQYLPIGKREMSLAELRSMLSAEDKYPLVKDFNRYVLAPSIEDINANTDLSIITEPVKEGRKIVGYRFVIHRAEQLQLI